VLRINCPFCGTRDHTEFGYGGDGSITYPELDEAPEEWVKAVFERENIAGPQVETWQHLYGCRMWLRVCRDTVTHEVLSVTPAHPEMAILGDIE